MSVNTIKKKGKESWSSSEKIGRGLPLDLLPEMLFVIPVISNMTVDIRPI